IRAPADRSAGDRDRVQVPGCAGHRRREDPVCAPGSRGAMGAGLPRVCRPRLVARRAAPARRLAARRVLPARSSGSRTLEAGAAGGVAEAGVVLRAAVAGGRDGAGAAAVALLLAGDADVGHAGRAVGGADAAAEGVEVGPAARVVEEPVLLAAAGVVALAA